MSSRRTTRRKMLGQLAGATLTLPAFISCNHPPGLQPVNGSQADPQAKKLAKSPNEQIGIGIIGCGRRNGQLMAGIGGQGAPPEHARIVAVADYNLKRAERWGRVHGTRKIYQDYRKLLDQKEVDVIVYATPEHQHYLPCIHACQAGKDMYGEQPLSHTIAEGRKMVEAVRKYKRVFQTGEQQRSHPETRKAVELIRNGRIGKLQRVIGYNYPSAWECDFPARPIPEWLNWDAWCGPNPVVPYHTDLYVSRAPYRPEDCYYKYPAEQHVIGPGWMSFRPYSGGELPNWGCHGLSMVHWALDVDETGPVEIWVDPAEKMEIVTYHEPENPARGDALCSKTAIHYKYANGVVLSLTSRDKKLGGGATFIGDKGKITIFRGGYECDPRRPRRRSPALRCRTRLRERQPHAQLLRLCRLPQRPHHEGRERPQRRHPVPPRQHRPTTRTKTQLGPPKRKPSPATKKRTPTSTSNVANPTNFPAKSDCPS